jgi:excisionase family DNA binding protein
MSESPLLTIAEAAERLKTDLTDVRMLIQTNNLDTTGTGNLIRIYRSSVLRYLEELRKSENPETPENGDGETAETPQNPEQIKSLPVLTVKDDKSVVPKTTTPRIGNLVAKNKGDVQESEEVIKKRQELVEFKALVDIETEHIQCEIKQAEAQRKRDLPETLAKKETELKAREEKIKAQEADLTKRAGNVAKVELDAQAKTVEADKYFTDKKEAADELYSAREFDTKDLEIECQNKRDEKENLTVKIDEAEKKLDEIGAQARLYLHQVNAHATQHYVHAVNSRGVTQTFHHEQANQGWDLEARLKKLMDELTAFLR